MNNTLPDVFAGGDSFKHLCRYAYEESRIIQVNEQGRPDFYFCKIDLTGSFFQTLREVKTDFFLITHNGCLSVRPEHPGVMDILALPRLKKWFGQNISFKHHKLESIPVGIANAIWPHGNKNVLRSVMSENHTKERIVYASYDVRTTSSVRQKCLDHTGVFFPKTDFKSYLTELAKSLFVISPNGSGFDCHRHWEALYLKCIPIVTDDNENIRFYRKMPFLMIKNWEEYKNLALSQSLYDSIWKSFDVRMLHPATMIDSILSGNGWR